MTDALIYDVASPKLPMKLEGRNVVGAGGFDRCGEISKMDVLSVCPDLRCPLPVSLAPVNATDTTLGITRRSSAVRSVLRASCLSEIVSATIKAVVVYVVSLSVWKSKNKIVKEDSFSSALGHIRSGINVGPSFVNEPTESTNNILVRIVNKCRVSLTEWYRDHNSILANLTEMETNPPGIKMKLKEA